MANPPAPVELPSGIATPAGITKAVNDRIRDLTAFIKGGFVGNPATSNADLAQKSIVNLADPVNDQDAVNLRTLKRIAPTTQTTTSVLATPGALSFNLVARGYGELDIEDLVVNSPENIDAVEFLAFAVDETDVFMSDNVGVDLDAAAATDPIKITPANQGAVFGGIASSPYGRLGRRVEVGDFLLIGAEIVRVTAVGAGSFTITRKTAPGKAWLGSALAAHAGADLWFKLFPFPFSIPARPNTAMMPAQVLPGGGLTALQTGGVPQRWTFAAPNLCIVAIVAQARTGSQSGASAIVNYSNGATAIAGVVNASNAPKIPGYRTMSGAAYTDLGVTGTLTAGKFADVVCRLQAWHTLRNIYGFVGTAPNNNGLSVIVLYYNPQRDVGYVVQRLAFQSGLFVSTDQLVDSRPGGRTDGVQMPFPPNLQQWPPAYLASVAMDIHGTRRAIWPLAAGGASLTQIAQDGWFDVVVDAADGASADLACVVQV